MIVLAPPLYRIPAGDDQRPVWANPRATTTSAAASVSALWTNDQTLPFAITQIAATAVPGAAQYLINLGFNIQDPGGALSSRFLGQQFTSTAAALVTSWGRMVSMIVAPRWRVQVESVFNAGAASNTIVLYVWGFFIPRGTIGLP